MHFIGDSVDAQHSGGVAGNAVYFLIRPFFTAEVEGGAA